MAYPPMYGHECEQDTATLHLRGRGRGTALS